MIKERNISTSGTNYVKIFRIMKLMTLFLIIGMSVSVAAKSYSQSTYFSMDLNNKTVKDVFNEIERKSNFVFFYYDGVLDVKRKVNIEASNQTVDKILDKLFEGTNNTYVIDDRQILISRKATGSQEPITTQKKSMLIGKVVDETGEALPGAAIMVAGSTRGVTTDIDGSFEIEVNSNEKITVSYLGMKDQTITVGNQKSIIIKLLAKSDELQEVTVVAFGKQKKESIIGAITTISVGDIKMPVGKISNNLAGQMAGIVSVQRSGEPGAGSDFWIRGVSTFGANSKPLILVDGIERSIDLVDYEDIESFSILKDATATAVYGVRGANGIVLITTKRGKESSKPSINAKVEFGALAPIQMPELANAEQWINYYNDISYDNTKRLAFSDYEKQKYLSNADPDLYPNVDWMKTIFKDATTNSKVNLSITGGGKVIRYYVAGSFYTENGIFNPEKLKAYNPSMRYGKYSFRSNIDLDITSSTQLALNLSNQYETKNRLGTDIATMWDQVLTTPPVAIPTMYSDGTLAMPLVGQNPYYSLNKTGFSQDFWNTSQSLIGITQDFSDIITPGLKANVKFSWDAVNESTLDKRKNPSTYYATGRDEAGELILHKNSDGSDYLSLSRSNRGSRTLNLEASATYENVFNEVHRVGGLVLFNKREYTNNFPGDYIAAFPYRNIGFAGRATYSYKDTYFIEGNFGYNGSENFAPNKRFGFFPSIALGYLISNEEYFKDLLPVINLLKIKGSYGEIGNDQIGGNRRFAYNSEMAWSGGYRFGSTGQQWRDGIATGYPGNPNVSWESAKKSNVGVELGLFDKLKIQADYFFDKREGIYILQESVPTIVGNNVQQYVNLGKMQNQGVDASMEYTHTIGDFYLKGRANFTFNRNKKLYDDKPTPVWAYQEEVNEPYDQHRGLIALGLFESEADIANSPKQTFNDSLVPGDIKYKDINGDGMINDYDRVAVGYTTIPEINYGFGVSAGWKGIDLSVFFQGVDNVSRFIGGSSIYGQLGSILVNGQIFSDVADKRWTLENPNPNAEYPRLSMLDRPNNKQQSTYWLRDMSFVRLKNAEIGYTIPKRITQKIGSSTVRVYIQGVNLLTFSKFKLWDPELATGNGGIYPQMRTVCFGLNINL